MAILEELPSRPPPLGADVDSDEEEEEEEEGISESEQWRLINESGILQRTMPRPQDAADLEEDLSLGDEMFNSVLYIIPFTFLYLMLNILIHQQYNQRVPLKEEVWKALTAVPALCLLIFYSMRYKSHRLMQAGFAVVGTAAGVRMIWLISNAGFNVVMQQCPPLGTIWVYTVVQMDLLMACLSCGAVAALVRYLNLKIIF